MPPNGRSVPQPIGLKLCRIARRGTAEQPGRRRKRLSAEIFSTTKMLFVVADSRMPTESRTLKPDDEERADDVVLRVH